MYRDEISPHPSQAHRLPQGVRGTSAVDVVQRLGQAPDFNEEQSKANENSWNQAPCV